MLGLARGLAYIHGLDAIHSDIKTVRIDHIYSACTYIYVEG